MPMQMKTVMSFFVLILVGTALIGPIASNVANLTNQSAGGANVTGAASVLTGLLTLFFVIILIAAVISYIRFGKSD